MGEGLSKPDEPKPLQGASGYGANLMAPWFHGRGGRPSDTVIIFDWDDTLLCSSAINMQQWSATQLQQLELTVETVLQASMDLGDTLIVTNGNRSWVQDSSRRFLPKLTPLLNRLRVMSARAAYEKSWPKDPFAWKRAAFQQVLSDRQAAAHLTPGGVNLVVLGDSVAEIQAAQTATLGLSGPSVVKTVKFKEMPSVNELLGELRVITQALPQIVNEECNQAKVLVPRALPQSPGPNMTAWASGWQVCDHRTGVALDLNSQSNLSFPGSPAPLVELQSPVTMAGG